MDATHKVVSIIMRKLLTKKNYSRIIHAFQDKHLGGMHVFSPYMLPNLKADSIELATLGIGVHHAGISMDDRRAIEDLFMKKILKVVVATSVSSAIVRKLR